MGTARSCVKALLRASWLMPRSWSEVGISSYPFYFILLLAGICGSLGWPEKRLENELLILWWKYYSNQGDAFQFTSLPCLFSRCQWKLRKDYIVSEGIFYGTGLVTKRSCIWWSGPMYWSPKIMSVWVEEVWMLKIGHFLPNGGGDYERRGKLRGEEGCF